MRVLLYIIAAVLFAVAFFMGGVHSTAGDLIALGLACFAAGHAAEPYLVSRRVV